MTQTQLASITDAIAHYSRLAFGSVFAGLAIVLAYCAVVYAS